MNLKNRLKFALQTGTFAVLCFIWSPFVTANTNTYSVETIAEGLLAAEAQFTDLQMEYRSEIRLYTKDDSTSPVRAVEAVFAMKKPKNLKYLDRKVFTIEPKTKQENLTENVLASFDGKATITLDRKVKQGKPLRGAIYPGCEQERFPRLDLDPHSLIWYFGNKQLGEILKQEDNNFHIETNKEMINGIPTVKIAGTIWDGTGTIKMWISPERNFLPIKVQVIRTRDERLLSETVLSNLVQLSNGLWFPKAIQCGSPDPFNAAKYSISKISVDPVPEELFKPAFPPNTFINDYVIGISYSNQEAEDIGLIGLGQVDNSIQQNPVLVQKKLDDYVDEAKKQENENIATKNSTSEPSRTESGNSNDSPIGQNPAVEVFWKRKIFWVIVPLAFLLAVIFVFKLSRNNN